MIIIIGSGKFEVSEAGTAVVSGLIRVTSNPAQEKIPINLLPQEDNEEETLTTKDIYKELRLRGYQYSGVFRALKSASPSLRKGHIFWVNNWVTFLDSMLQMEILGMDTRNLYVPTRIQKIIIDAKAHQTEIRKMDLEDRSKCLEYYYILSLYRPFKSSIKCKKNYYFNYICIYEFYYRLPRTRI